MTKTPSCTIHAAPMTLKQGERGKTFWACLWCDNESTERLRSICESAKPEDHKRFKELWEKREAERYWFYDYLCEGCKARISKAIIARVAAAQPGDTVGEGERDMSPSPKQVIGIVLILGAVVISLPLEHLGPLLICAMASLFGLLLLVKGGRQPRLEHGLWRQANPVVDLQGCVAQTGRAGEEMNPGIIGAVYLRSIHVAYRNNQIVGEKRDLYVTIEQLEAILQEIAREQAGRAAEKKPK